MIYGQIRSNRHAQAGDEAPESEPETVQGQTFFHGYNLSPRPGFTFYSLKNCLKPIVNSQLKNEADCLAKP